MKKTLFVLSLIAFATVVHAQPTYGIHANGIMANVKGEYTEDGETFKDEGKYRFSWKAGVFANVPLTDNFSFMPQLNLLSKGTKIEESGTETISPGLTYNYTIDGNAKYTYLELPLYFLYNSNSETGGFFGGVGPVISYGIGGEEKATTTISLGGDSQSETTTNNVKFDGKPNATDEDSHYEALEFGAGIIAGYRLSNGIFVNAHYNHGLSNISPEDNTKYKNRYFGLGIGYVFGSR
jgi:hypothetical protein